jgi:hypothetical protein
MMEGDHPSDVALCRNAPLCTRPADHEGGCEGAVEQRGVMVVSQEFYDRVKTSMKPCSECKGQNADCKRCGGEGVEWRA